MKTEQREPGIYEEIKELPFNTGKITFVTKCIRHFFPKIYHSFHFMKIKNSKKF